MGQCEQFSSLLARATAQSTSVQDPAFNPLREMLAEISRTRPIQRIVRFIVGNPLIVKEMAKHVPDADSYAPATLLVDECADGVHLSYDRMASFPTS